MEVSPPLGQGVRTNRVISVLELLNVMGGQWSLTSSWFEVTNSGEDVEGGVRRRVRLPIFHKCMRWCLPFSVCRLLRVPTPYERTTRGLPISHKPRPSNQLKRLLDQLTDPTAYWRSLMMRHHCREDANLYSTKACHLTIGMGWGCLELFKESLLHSMGVPSGMNHLDVGSQFWMPSWAC